MRQLWSDGAFWAVFIWAAVFSFVAVSLKIARELAHQHQVGWRDVMRSIIDVLTVTFFGGLFGWAMALVFPNLTNESPTVVAIGAALMAYSGLNATQDILYRFFSTATGTKISRSNTDEEKK